MPSRATLTPMIEPDRGVFPLRTLLNVRRVAMLLVELMSIQSYAVSSGMLGRQLKGTAICLAHKLLCQTPCDLFIVRPISEVKQILPPTHKLCLAGY